VGEWLLFNANSATSQAEFELACSPITLNLNVSNEINRILQPPASSFTNDNFCAMKNKYFIHKVDDLEI
jgi:hypothetical protein